MTEKFPVEFPVEFPVKFPGFVSLGTKLNVEANTARDSENDQKRVVVSILTEETGNLWSCTVF